MKCRQCQAYNKEGAKFCGKCGSELFAVCPQCGAENDPENNFCNECGHNLRESREALPIDFSAPQSYTPKFLAEKILTTRSSIEGERKLVTVLFADVANYTSIAEKLDPEQVHQIMDGCFKILMDEIHRYEGTINQFTGDGVMALFGAPVAHENHAQRACNAALSIQQSMTKYTEKIRSECGVEFTMRIGLNSGPVIVGSIGDDLRMDYTAIGDTTNLAARIQQNAKAGQVFVSQETFTIIRDFFQCEFVGKTPLKGKVETQSVYRVIAEHTGVRTRFEAGLVRGVTELVGRLPEMETLQSLFEKVKTGEAQIVDVIGEAGIGKSRLVYEFRKALGNEARFLIGLCIQYGGNINFLPIKDIVKAAFGIEEDMSEKEARSRIENRAADNLASMIPFYQNLLSLRVEDQRFQTLEPEGRKFGTFEAVKDLLLALSREKPLVVFIEDVHWMDKISEEFFTYFSRCMLEHPILMLSAYRPEGSPSWAQGGHYQRLGLETLSSKSSIRLVRNVLGGLTLDPELEQKIAQKAGGNPFFVEEIVREFLERGDIVRADDRYICQRPIDQLEIPNTIQGVLAARMDRLSEDLKRTMQVASVIGRDFAFRILKYITELGEELKSYLGNLVGLEILYEKALYPELEYIFKHALTQEVAYNSLLKQRRQEIHGRIALAIEELYSDRLEEHYELLAHHYERSGNAEKAVDYLILAGEKSILSCAVQAASEFFDRALEVAKSNDLVLDASAEIRLYRARGQASFGIGSVGKSVEDCRKTMELSRIHGMIDYEKESLYHVAATTYLWPVKVEAERFLEEGIARAREMEDKALESCILTHKGLLAAMYGQPYEGGQMMLDAGRMAKGTGDPKSMFISRYYRSYAERWLGRPRRTIELTEGMHQIMRDMWNVSRVPYVISNRGTALAEIGRVDEAIKILKEGIDFCEKLGMLVRLGCLYNTLGYCYSEIHHSEIARELNLKGEEIAREMKGKYPMGRRQYAEMAAQSSVNLMENLFDQRETDAAWDRLKALEEEAKSEDFDMLRHRWESRMNYLAAQIHLQRNDLDQAEIVIQPGLKKARKEHHKKREGSFLRLLGEIQVRCNNSDSAIENLREAISILAEVGNPRKLWEAQASLASAFDKLGRSTEALEQWGAAAGVIQGLANDLSDRELRRGFLQAEPIRAILAKAES